MDADRRAEIIRDLDKHVRDAATSVAHIDRLFRQLMETDESAMSIDDTITAGNALQAVIRELPELRRIFAKQVRLLAGPPPRLAIRATDEPERLAIIARYPDRDLDVGDARRTGSGDSAGWRIRLTDPGSGSRGSIGLCHDATLDEVLDAVNHHVEELGPWWEREGNDG